jgi:tetratricopeptide (TPR) repeat protein
MKKSLVMLVLVFAIEGIAQTAPQSAPQGAGQPAQQAAPAQQKKEIKDPAEYNSYMAAINTQDPNAKATALEGFITQYPNSVMKEDALELLMRTYQQLNNIPKTMETANRVLQTNPSNVTALALLSYLNRLQAQAGQDPQNNLAQSRQFAERGLQALQTYQKPEGMSDLDFGKLKDQLAGIFNASIGIAALQANEFPVAQKALQDAAGVSPNDFSIIYPLALSYLNAPQPDYLKGLWYIARAANLAPTPQYKQQISEFGRRKYMKFHGGDDGWPDVLTMAQSQPIAPATFAIKPAPTPAEQAAKMCAEKTAAQMSFDEIQFVLTSGNQQCADQVWGQIKEKPLAMVGNVVASTPTQLQIAGTYDDINATPPKADITLTMAGEMTAKQMPKPGQQQAFQGKPTSYTPNPFMMEMTDGTLVVQKGSTPAAKKPVAHKPVPRKK